MDPSPVEKRTRCPWCGESIVLVLDLSAGPQSCVEDCQVCCQPMQVAFEAEDGELRSIRVERA